MPSDIIIQCPKCGEELEERQGEIVTYGYISHINQYDVELYCKKCGVIDFADFFEKEGGE